MTDDELINMWNRGLTKVAVAKKYMLSYNKKISNQINMKKINIIQALAYVEPILFKYRMNQLNKK